MKKSFFLSIFLLVTIFLSLFNSYAYAEKTEPVESVEIEIEYYGRAALAELEGAEEYLFAYDAITKGIENAEAEIDVYNKKRALSVEELSMVFEVYRRDRTDHFWLGNTYSVMRNSRGDALALRPTYLYEGAQLVAARDEFDRRVEEILSTIDPEWTEFEKELYIHDYLAREVTYIEAENAHNAFGAIVDGKAVCEGYAEAFQHLCQRVGIQSFIALGSSVNPSTGTREGHAWNYVRIDGKYYQVDLTWNDQGERLYHAYFNATDDEIDEEHDTDEAAFRLPVCNSKDNNYFTVKGGRVKWPYSVSEVSALFDPKTLTASVYTSETFAFTRWLEANRSAVASRVGVSGSYRFAYSIMGFEVRLEILACKHLSMDAVPATSPTCTEKGNTPYYVCECGAKFHDLSAKLQINDMAEVIIYPLGHNFREEIIDEKHLRYIGDCKTRGSYWYDCSRCDVMASEDKDGALFYYTVGGVYHALEEAFGYKTEVGHARRCSVAGCDYHELIKLHTPNAEATDDTPSVCTECGYIITPAKNHTEHTPRDTWEKDADGHWHACSGCEGQRLEYSQHVDEDDNGICEACGATFIKSAAHNKSLFGLTKIEEGTLIILGCAVIAVIAMVAIKLSFRRRYY